MGNVTLSNASEAAPDAAFEGAPEAAFDSAFGNAFDNNMLASEAKGKQEEKPYLVDKAQQEQATAELSYEEKLKRANTLFKHNRRYRLAFLTVLRQCADVPCELNDLEELVKATPGYHKQKQPPYFPIHWLVESYALEELYLDHEGNIYAAEDLEELTEDEFDDLIVAYAYRCTDVGHELKDQYAAKTQTMALFEKEPERRDIYLDVLRFVQEKKHFGQVEHLIHDRVAKLPASLDGKKPQTSVFIDKLEEAGAIAFNGGWIITDEGKEFLDSIDHAQTR